MTTLNLDVVDVDQQTDLSLWQQVFESLGEDPSDVENIWRPARVAGSKRLYLGCHTGSFDAKPLDIYVPKGINAHRIAKVLKRRGVSVSLEHHDVEAFQNVREVNFLYRAGFDGREIHTHVTEEVKGQLTNGPTFVEFLMFALFEVVKGNLFLPKCNKALTGNYFFCSGTRLGEKVVVASLSSFGNGEGRISFFLEKVHADTNTFVARAESVTTYQSTE